MPKENFVFRFFKFIILFFLTDLTAKNQPETTTKPDKQIPGTILSMKLHYNIQEFFQINDWTLVSVEITVIFRYTGNCLLHLEHSCLLLLWDMSLPKERSIFLPGVLWPLFLSRKFCWKMLAVGSSFLNPFSGHLICAKRLAKIFWNAVSPTLRCFLFLMLK